MKKKVVAVIDNAERCPYFGYKSAGILEFFLRIFHVPHNPNCYHPATSKPGFVRKCNCVHDKATDKYIIKDGCPLESVIDEETKRAVLAQLQKEAAEADAVEIDAAVYEQEQEVTA